MIGVDGLLSGIGSPPILAFAGSVVCLAVGLFVVRTSRSASPADRYFVLLLATLASGAVLALGFVSAPLASAMHEIDLRSGVASHDLSPTAVPRPTAAVWLGAVGIGAGLLLWRRLGGTFVVDRMVREAEPAPGELRDVFYDACGDIYVRGGVDLVVSDRARGPFVTGVLRPTIVVPRSLLERDRAAQRDVLRHELAHVARRDTLSQLATQLAGTLMWWNPLFWLASRDLTLLRELACDDAATFGRTDRSSYASLLRDYARSHRWTDALGFGQIRMAAALTINDRLFLLADNGPLSASLSAYLPRYASRADVVATSAVYGLVFGASDMAIVMLGFQQPPPSAAETDRSEAIEPSALEIFTHRRWDGSDSP